jgi:hypothetical protein
MGAGGIEAHAKDFGTISLKIMNGSKNFISPACELTSSQALNECSVLTAAARSTAKLVLSLLFTVFIMEQS